MKITKKLEDEIRAVCYECSYERMMEGARRIAANELAECLLIKLRAIPDEPLPADVEKAVFDTAQKCCELSEGIIAVGIFEQYIRENLAPFMTWAGELELDSAENALRDISDRVEHSTRLIEDVISILQNYWTNKNKTEQREPIHDQPCPLSFLHPAHDRCDENSTAKPFASAATPLPSEPSPEELGKDLWDRHSKLLGNLQIKWSQLPVETKQCFSGAAVDLYRRGVKAGNAEASRVAGNAYRNGFDIGTKTERKLRAMMEEQLSAATERVRALEGALKRMVSAEFDWEDGQIGVGHAFRQLANDALAKNADAGKETP